MKREDFYLETKIWTKAALIRHVRERYRLIIDVSAMETVGEAILKAELPTMKRFGVEFSYVIYYFHDGVPDGDGLQKAGGLAWSSFDEVLVKPLWPYLNPHPYSVVVPHNGHPINKISAWIRKNMSGDVLLVPCSQNAYIGFDSKADFVKAKLSLPLKA